MTIFPYATVTCLFLIKKYAEQKWDQFCKKIFITPGRGCPFQKLILPLAGGLCVHETGIAQHEVNIIMGVALD